MTDCCCCECECESEIAYKKYDRKNVGCTDVLFLIFFIAFWVGMVCIAVVAIIQGDASKIFFLTDSYGNTCGEDNYEKSVENVPNSGQNNLEQPYIFFFDISNPVTSVKICVSACPNETLFSARDVDNFYDVTRSKLCMYSVATSEYRDSSLYRAGGPCPQLPILSSMPVLHRCLPNPELPDINMTELDHVISYLNKVEFVFRDILSDLYSVWTDIIYLSLIAVGLSIIIQLIMKYLAGLIIYITIIASSVASVVATVMLWITWNDIHSDRMRAEEQFDTVVLEIDINNETAFFMFAVAMSVFTVLLTLVIAVLFKRLQLVIAIFGEAAKCVLAMPLLLLTPLFTLTVLLAFAAAWLIVFTFINTMDKAVPFENNGTMEVTYESLVQSDIFFWYYIVGGIWGLEFLVAAEQFVILSAVTVWYFNRQKPTTPVNCIVCQGFFRLIRYHIGTIAFGSFIITLVKLPRYLCMYLHSQLKDSHSVSAQAVLKCITCCLWCLENILKFINKNAYVITSVEGKSYCPAAKRAFTLLVSNALRVATLNSIEAFMFFCAKIAVVALTVAISILWFRDIDGLHFSALPVVIVSILAFFIAHSLISVYGTICDTLLLCFCIDCDVNDGSPRKKYYMDATLLTFVQKSSVQLNGNDARIRPEEASFPKKSVPQYLAVPALTSQTKKESGGKKGRQEIKADTEATKQSSQENVQNSPVNMTTPPPSTGHSTLETPTGHSTLETPTGHSTLETPTGHSKLGSPAEHSPLESPTGQSLRRNSIKSSHSQAGSGSKSSIENNTRKSQVSERSSSQNSLKSGALSSSSSGTAL